MGDNRGREILTQIMLASFPYQEEVGIKARNVDSSGMHIMIIDINGKIWVCGSNCSGQLGLANTVNRNILTEVPNIKGRQISCGFFFSQGS